MLPTVVVEGVGAVALPVPPVAVVYQSKPVPVAVRAVAVEFWQYVTGLVTVGNAGVVMIVTIKGVLTLSPQLKVCVT